MKKKKQIAIQSLSKKVIQRIMDRGMIINKECKEHCRDFRIMVSEMQPNILILRWTSIDISDEDRPVQCYRYECFQKDGTPRLCSIKYSDLQEANDFFLSLETLYKQEFSIDHTL